MMILFRYSRWRSRADVFKYCDALAVKFKLRKGRLYRKTIGGIDAEDLNEVAAEFFTTKEIESLKAARRIPLPKARVKLLCKPFTVSCRDYCSKDKKVQFQIEASERNNYPCLASDLWLSKSRYLP